MRVKKNKWAIPALAALLFLLALAAAWQLDFFADNSAAPMNSASVKAKEKREPDKAKDAAAEKPQAKTQARETKPNAPVRQIYSSDSTLGDLSRIRGQKILLEQQVRIAELEQRLKEVSQPKPQIILPELTPPKSKKEESSPAIVAPRRGPVVVSVQGVGKEISATLRNGEGKLLTLRNGATFAGGVIQISLKSVAVRRGGKLSPIPFE